MIQEFVDRQAVDTDLVELTDQQTGEARQYRTKRLETVTEPGTPLNKQTLDPLLHAIRGVQDVAGNPVSIPETVASGYPFAVDIHPETNSWMHTRHGGGVSPDSPGQLICMDSVTARSSNKNLCSFAGTITASNQYIYGYSLIDEVDTLVYTLGRGVYTYSAYIDNTKGDGDGRVDVYRVSSTNPGEVEPLKRKDIPAGEKGRAYVTVDYGAIDTSDVQELRLGVTLNAQGAGKTASASLWQMEAGYSATEYTPHVGADKTVSVDLIKLSDTLYDRIFWDIYTARWKLERNIQKLIISSPASPNPKAYGGDRTRFYHWDSYADTDPAKLKYSLCSHFPYGDENGTNVFYRDGGNWAFMVSNDLLGITSTDTEIQRGEKWKTWVAEHNITIYSAYYPSAKPAATDLFENIDEDAAFTEIMRPQEGATHISLDKEPEYGGMLTLLGSYPMGRLGADVSNLTYKMTTIDAITVSNAVEKAQAALTTANTALTNIQQVTAVLEAAIGEMDDTVQRAEAAAQAAESSGAAADAAAEHAEQAAKDAETVIASADVRFANAITGSGAGASVSCPQIWTGAPLVSAEIQGHTVEQGEGEKGPYNPYRFVGVAPTKITLAGTEQNEEVALPEIAPLHSLPTGIHDAYDPATGIEIRRAGMYIITGQESKWSVMTRNRIYTTKPANTPPWSGTVQLDEQTAHGINVSISDNLYIWIDFLVEESDTDTEIAQKAREYFQGQVEAGTPVTVTYPLKEPEIIQHDPIAMRPPQSPATVSADQGELSVTYVKDTNQVVDGLEARVAALEKLVAATSATLLKDAPDKGVMD